MKWSVKPRVSLYLIIDFQKQATEQEESSECGDRPTAVIVERREELLLTSWPAGTQGIRSDRAAQWRFFTSDIVDHCCKVSKYTCQLQVADEGSRQAVVRAYIVFVSLMCLHDVGQVGLLQSRGCSEMRSRSFRANWRRMESSRSFVMALLAKRVTLYWMRYKSEMQNADDGAAKIPGKYCKNEMLSDRLYAPQLQRNLELIPSIERPSP